MPFSVDEDRSGDYRNMSWFQNNSPSGLLVFVVDGGSVCGSLYKDVGHAPLIEPQTIQTQRYEQQLFHFYSQGYLLPVVPHPSLSFAYANTPLIIIRYSVASIALIFLLAASFLSPFSSSLSCPTSLFIQLVNMPKIEKGPAHRLSVSTASAAGGTRSSSWSARDDETLIQARAQGLNWNQIGPKHFPSKTPNACRKRHERLMERQNAEQWDGVKLDVLAQAYMEVRRDMWSMLAARVGEKWQLVETKVRHVRS